MGKVVEINLPFGKAKKMIVPLLGRIPLVGMFQNLCVAAVR